MVQQFGDFHSPRHKHNFEQVRLQLAGTISYDGDGTMTPGVRWKEMAATLGMPRNKL